MASANDVMVNVRLFSCLTELIKPSPTDRPQSSPDSESVPAASPARLVAFPSRRPGAAAPPTVNVDEVSADGQFIQDITKHTSYHRVCTLNCRPLSLAS